MGRISVSPAGDTKTKKMMFDGLDAIDGETLGQAWTPGLRPCGRRVCLTGVFGCWPARWEML